MIGMVGVQPRYVRLGDKIVVDCDVFVLAQVGVWGWAIGNAGWHGACMGGSVGDFPGDFWSFSNERNYHHHENQLR